MTERKPEGATKERCWGWLILVALVLLALATRGGLTRLERVIKWDESDYLMLGRNLLAGKGFTTAGYPEVHYPPLVPVAFGLAHLITPSPEAASDLVYVLSGALVLLPLYGLGRRLYGQRVTYLGLVLLVAFAPLAISVLYWGTMSEPIYLVLIYTGLYALWRALQEDKVGYYALAGLMFALAYLARPEAILYWGIFMLFALAWHALQGSLRAGGAWRGLASLVGIFLLCALPYVIYLRVHTGQWTFTGKVGVTFDLGAAVIDRDPAAYDRATASLDESGQHIIWFSPTRFDETDMGSQVLSDPLGFARRMVANLLLWEGRFFAKSVFPYWCLGLVLLGLCRQAWGRSRTWGEAFLLAALVPPFGFLALHVELRFFAPLFPILLLWTAKGADELGLWLRDTVANWRDRPLASTGAQALRLAPAALLLLYLALMWPLAAQAGRAGTDLGPKHAGLWLQEHTPAEARVLSRDVAVAVYANRDWVPSPHAEYPAFLAYARHHGVNYMVITQREATVLRPWLGFLLDAANAPPELALAHQVETPLGLTLIYQLKGER